jgi:diguanylate cyclase (GGDEF)-like protein/PAS domain S-box-containing protein
MFAKRHSKFAIIGVTLVTIMATLYITFFYTIGYYKSQLSHQDETSALSGLLSKLEGDILRTRLIEKRYQINHEPYLVVAFQHGIDQIIKVTSEIQSDNKDGRLYDSIVLMTRAIAQYQFLFTDLEKQYDLIGYDSDHGLHGQLRNATNNVERLLNILPDETSIKLDAINSLQALRRNEKDFIQRTDSIYIDLFSKEIVLLKNYIANIDSTHKAELILYIDEYQSSFVTLANMTLSSKDLLNEIEKTLAIIPELLLEFRQEIVALETRRHALFENQVELINFNLIASAPLAVILTWLLMSLYWRNAKINIALSEANEVAVQEHELSMTTLRSIGDSIIITDAKAEITNINPAAEELLEQDLTSICGQPVTQVINIQDLRNHDTIQNPVLTCLQSKSIIVQDNKNMVLCCGNDKTVPVQTSVAPILGKQNKLLGAIMIIRDVSEQRELLQKIEHQAYHDPLTGLINRHALTRELIMAWGMCKDYQSEHSLVFIDLDRFKVVNDTCGHHAGDELLKDLTNLIRQQIRRSDVLSDLDREESSIGDALARVGGDEFALFLRDCPLDAAKRISLHIIESIKEYVFIWDHKQFRVGASIGIAAMTENSSSINEVMRNADSACYEAKNLGRGKVFVHTLNHEEIDRRQKEIAWVPRIHQALAENHFALRRQPITPLISADDQRYFEVLISLKGNNRDEYIPPNAFLPAAERYHMLEEIDRWVIAQAFKEMANNDSRAIYAINLSIDSLADSEILNYIQSGLNHYHLDPRRLIFEISGSAAIKNLQTCNTLIETLRGQGCRFALGDFGPSLGYFSYMKALKVDFVKIDGNLMKNVARDMMDYTIVESIHQLAHKLGMATIAVFVEDDACLNSIKNIGIDYAQGWAIGKPEIWSNANDGRQRSLP